MSEVESALKVDLTNCEREPIHIPGLIQDFGCLIAMTRDWIVTRVSANSAEFFGAEPDDMLGLPAVNFLGEGGLHAVRGRLQLLSGADSVERIFGICLNGDELQVDMAVHMSGESIVLEIEPHRVAPHESSTAVRTMMDRAGREETLESLTQLAARHVRALTGFDRVMVYRFQHDDSGEVIAEARHGDAEPFLGLRYPASDIPKQARALYKRNLLRIISDVGSVPVPVVPQYDPARRPLDLSMSTLRAVSPIHVEYLRNMGVSASLSISILVDGELWGLFACHHDSPRVLSYAERSVAELYGQLFSFVLERLLHRIDRADAAAAKDVHDRLMGQLAAGHSMMDSLAPAAETLKRAIGFEGVALCVDGEVRLSGATPAPDQLPALLRFLNTADAAEVFATDCLAELHAPAADYADRVAGLLAIPVSRRPRDYMILFRQEVARHVTWAGNPQKPVEATGPNGVRLTPRKSFEAWREIVRGRSMPWTASDLRAAEQLRITLLEVVLRLTDAAAADRRQSESRQELLIAELNHRVRNILGLINGLIGQTKAEASSLGEFTEMVGGRVHALARAHDQITRDQWNPASFRMLVEAETEAFLGAGRCAVHIIGPELMVQPGAFATLALVVHELMTNSAKYGSLSDSRGRVDVTIAENAAGDAMIEWREIGGPPVQPPKRRGFGSTIIERSIPHELKGDAQIDYDVTGIVARFRLPVRHVASISAAEAVEGSPGGRTAVAPAEPSPLKGCSVLLLEDNMVIAMEAEEMLNRLGAASVRTCTGVDNALSELEQRRPDIAVIDVNLGDETSEPVAERLRELGVPFVVATGYGEAGSILQRFHGVPVVQKPFGDASLGTAISEVLATSLKS